MTEIDRAPGGAVTRRHFFAAAAGLATGATLYRGDAGAAAGPLMTRPIPRTGERLPAVGLGTAIAFDIGEDPVRRAERSLVIAAPIENGARVIDTAPSYGTAESVVGDLVAGLGVRERVFLATKVRELKLLAPMPKGLLIQACFATVTADGTIRLVEAELMRVIGAVLDCPLPPLLETIDPLTLAA